MSSKKILITLVFAILISAAVYYILTLEKNIEIDLSTPESAYATYLRIAEKEDCEAFYNLPSSESMDKLFGKRQVKASQLRTTYNDLKDRNPRSEINGDMAIIYIEPPSDKSPPFFLIKENGLWKFDFLRMNKTYYMDHNNKWHYQPGKKPNSPENQGK